jgi:hypothetical protein
MWLHCNAWSASSAGMSVHPGRSPCTRRLRISMMPNAWRAISAGGACRYEAIRMLPRPQTMLVGFDASQVDPAAIHELCRKAHLLPDQPVQVCSGTRARKFAGQSCTEPGHPRRSLRLQERAGCVMYCMGPILRLLHVSGVELALSMGVGSMTPRSPCVGHSERDRRAVSGILSQRG